MKIVTNLPRLRGFDAITAWPFIFITEELSNNVPLIEHERVHYREQRAVLTIPWLLAYWLSKRFRFEAEVRGHAKQVALGGGTIQWAAWHIAEKYNTGRTIEQAYHALALELDKDSP